jgi:hypothetical protein
MKIQTVRSPRTGMQVQLLSLVLIAWSIPLVGCSEFGHLDLAEESTGNPSSAVSPHPSNARESVDPLLPVVPERETFKREGWELLEPEIYRLTEQDDLPEVAVFGRYSGRPYVSASAGVNQIDTAPETSSGPILKPALVTDPKKSQRSGSSSAQLMSLQYAYRSAMRDLFGGSRGGRDQILHSDASFEDALFGDHPFEDHNPFEEVLGSSDAVPQESSSPQADNPAPAPEPAKLSNLALAAAVVPLYERIDELPDGPLNFLLTGDFSDDGDQKVFRAIRDDLGRFALENYTRYTLSGGFLPFRKDEPVFTTDLNGDGAVDLVVARRGSRDLVEVFKGDGSTLFQNWTSISTSKSIIGISAFELSGDDQDDLVLIAEGVPRLLVYERSGSGFTYSHELVLPFQPGLLVEAQESPEERRLYVFDSTMSEVVALSSIEPDVLVSGLDSVFDQFDILNPEGSKSLFLDLGGRITLAQFASDRIISRGSFAVTHETPLVILGDYQSSGSNQLLWVP